MTLSGAGRWFCEDLVGGVRKTGSKCVECMYEILKE